MRRGEDCGAPSPTCPGEITPPTRTRQKRKRKRAEEKKSDPSAGGTGGSEGSWPHPPRGRAGGQPSNGGAVTTRWCRPPGARCHCLAVDRQLLDRPGQTARSASQLAAADIRNGKLPDTATPARASEDRLGRRPWQERHARLANAPMPAVPAPSRWRATDRATGPHRARSPLQALLSFFPGCVWALRLAPRPRRRQCHLVASRDGRSLHGSDTNPDCRCPCLLHAIHGSVCCCRRPEAAPEPWRPRRDGCPGAANGKSMSPPLAARFFFFPWSLNTSLALLVRCSVEERARLATDFLPPQPKSQPSSRQFACPLCAVALG